MRDADDCCHAVPDSFSHASMEAFLYYVYHDEVADSMKASQVADLLHVACYYGVPRLVSRALHSIGCTRNNLLILCRQ